MYVNFSFTGCLVKFTKKERQTPGGLNVSFSKRYREEDPHLFMQHEQGHEIFKEHGVTEKPSDHSSVRLLSEKEMPPTTSFEKGDEDENLLVESRSTSVSGYVSNENEFEILSEDVQFSV